MVEAFITDDDSTPRVRRLHLIVVDLNRRRLATRVSRQLSKINVDECAAQCWNTLPIPWKQDQETYELRYIFGYAMDGTDLPCYILWAIRTEDHSFWCLDAWKGDWVQLDKCGFIAPVGIEHFFDAFCFSPQRPWRTAASQALGIPSCHIAEDTHIEQLEENKFTLTPRRIPTERRATAEKSGADQDPCQVRGCLDYFSIVCIRVPVGSQDLKAVSLKEPIKFACYALQEGSSAAPMANCEANVPIHATSPVHQST